MIRLEIPKLDWPDRYGMLIDLAFGFMTATWDAIETKHGKDELMMFTSEVHPRMTGPIADRLAKKLGLKPNIDGALKLLGIYIQEVWGFGYPGFVELAQESPNNGIFTVLRCRTWERWEETKRMPCDLIDAFDYRAALNALAPTKFNVTVLKSRPRGDDRCEWAIEYV